MRHTIIDITGSQRYECYTVYSPSQTKGIAMDIIAIPEVIICVLPRKMRNLGICVEMGNYAINLLEQFPQSQLIRDDIVFISNKVPAHLIYHPNDIFRCVQQNNYHHILILVPLLSKKAPAQKFYGDIINELTRGNHYVQTIECVV